MKTSSVVKWTILILGCAVGTPGFALDGLQSGKPSQVQKELHANSPTTTSLYKNVEGKLKEIKGDLFILEDSQGDQQIQVRVGKDTAFPNGQKEPGQPVQALVSAQDGHALIIR